MQITSMTVSGFRSVLNLQNLPIGSPTLLTGHNDSGKTTLLDALRFLLGDYILLERDRTFADAEISDVESSSPSRVDETIVEGLFELTDEEQAELRLESQAGIRRRSIGGSAPVWEILSEAPSDARFRQPELRTMPQLKALLEEIGAVIPKGNKEALVDAVRDREESSDTSRLWVPLPSEIRRALPKVHRFEATGSDDAESSIRAALQTAYRGHLEDEELQGDIRVIEQSLEDKLKLDAESIRAHIAERCADIGVVEILPSVSFSSGLRETRISVNGREGEDVHLGESGAGRARRVALAVWEYTTGLLNSVGDVVLLYDEPDTHLDYTHQRDFMRVVREQSRLPNVRMVIATHSMNLIDGVDISDVVHVRHEDHRTVADQLQDASGVGVHLGAVAASLGLRNTVLLHERLFVGVEGPTEVGALPVLFRLGTGRHLESCGIAIWGCRNNEGAADFASFLVANHRNVAFVVDADSRNIKHVFAEAKLRNRGLDPAKCAFYIGDPNEIEDLFSDDQWVNVANVAWRRGDGADWNPSDFAALRGGKFSKDLFTLLRTESPEGPSGKPDVMIEMALSLRASVDVPEQLRSVFDELIRLAA